MWGVEEMLEEGTACWERELKYMQKMQNRETLLE
jgi:hypothetical protein